jgi:dienelactone hydrolase
MSDNDLCGWLPTALEYSAKGYRTAVFAYSGRQAADADVLQVVAELQRRGSTRIVLVGASKGGTSVLSAAARAKAVAVVELSAPSLYEGMDAGVAVKSLGVPTWFAVGEGDEEFVPSAKELYAASAATTKHLEVVASASHGTELLSQGGVGPMIAEFLAKNAPA